MKRLLVHLLWFVTALALFPSMTLAGIADEPDKIYDARLESYPGSVTLENWSTALMWLLLITLGAGCVGVMFKSSKRTHLD